MLIRLIGPVTAVIGGEAQPFTAPKMAGVLATLAISAGQPVTMSTLIDHLWATDPPASAVSVLYSYIARLRAMFRNTDGIHVGRVGSQGYALETDPSNIDVHRVGLLSHRATALVRAGDLSTALHSWREADGVARGEALVGVGGRWAEEYRAEFRNEQRLLKVNRFTTELALGNHAVILEGLIEAVAREPIAEPLVEQLMLAQYRCGRADDALKSFEQTRTVLLDRLGADPSPQLQDLHRRILARDPALEIPASDAQSPVPGAAARTVPNQLPPDPEGFVGRDDAAASIAAKSATHRVVVIDGMAGVGKTALAVHVAHRLAAEYPDGQLFVDLRGYADGINPVGTDQAVTQLLHALDIEVPDEVTEREAAFRTALAGRRVILVLDNARDSSQVLPLLPGTADCLTIITSRRRLVGLVDARPVSLDVLSTGHAGELFVAEAGLDGVDPEVEEIVRVCGRLPLALRIAAARLRRQPTWTPTDLLQRLTHRLSALGEWDGPATGVVAAFELSYQDLSLGEQRVFRLLSLSPGEDFGTGTAAVLADVTRFAADEALESLVDAHLVIPQRAGRYRLHDLLRRYGSSRLSDATEGDDAWHRLVDDYIGRAGHAGWLVRPNFGAIEQAPPANDAPADRIEAKDWFARELPTIAAIINTEFEREHHSQVVALCDSTQRYLMHRKMSPLRLRLAQQGATAAANLGGILNQARLENQVGLSHFDVGDFDVALAHFERGRDLSRQIGDHQTATMIGINIASVHQDRGDLQQAIQRSLSAAEATARYGPPLSEAMSRSNAAKALLMMNRTAEADAQLDRAEEIATEVGDEVEQARVVFNRATSHRLSGDLDAARSGYRHVAEFCRRHDENDGLVSALAGLTDVALDEADHERALHLAQEQLDRLSDAILRSMEPEILTQLGRAQSGLGRFEDAEESLRAAISSAEQIGAGRLRAMAEHALGEHLLQDDRHRQEAVGLLEAAAAFYAAGGYPQAAPLRSRIAEVVTPSDR